MAKVLDAYTLEYEQGKISIKILSAKPVPIYTISLIEVSDNVNKILHKIREHVTSDISFDILNLSVEERMDIENEFKKNVTKIMKKAFPELDKEAFSKLLNHILVTSLGLGEIEYLLKDPELEEVVVNGSKQPVWIYHKRFGWLKTNIVVSTESNIYNYAAAIGRRVGTQITNLNPLMDAYLTTGDRANATLFPISSKGNTLTIRKFARRPWTITDFIETGTLSCGVVAM